MIVWNATATRHSGVGNLREDTNPTPNKEGMDCSIQVVVAVVIVVAVVVVVVVIIVVVVVAVVVIVVLLLVPVLS